VISLGKIAALSILLSPLTAMASTLCPGDASQGGFNATYSSVPGATGPGGVCTTGAVTVSLAASNNGEGKLVWTSADSGYPSGLTFSNLAGIDATVSNVSGDQPYFFLSFNDNALAPNPGDQLLFIEFQLNNVVGGTSMPVDPASTLFNLYDNTTGVYLAGGQADVHTLDSWISADPSVAGDSIASIDLVNGLSGGCSQGGCPASFTADSVSVTESVAATPEPASIVSLATGLLSIGGRLVLQRRKAARVA